MVGPLSFSKGSLREIGEYLSLVVEEPRSMGKFFRPFNSTFIANIPKTNNPLSFDSYKPISLCRCVYKTVPKLYSLNMLEPILSSFISDEQFGFLPGRQIFDTVGITQEVSILLNQRSLPLHHQAESLKCILQSGLNFLEIVINASHRIRYPLCQLDR